MPLRSLRWQIQLWHAALLVALVAAVLVAFYGYERRARVARIDAELTGPLVSLLPQVLPVPGVDPPPQGENLVQSLESSNHYILVLFKHADQTGYVTKDAPPPLAIPADAGVSRIFGRWNGSNRELVNLTPRGDAIILGRRAASIAAELRGFTLKLVLLGTAVVTLGLLGGHFIARRAIRPLRTIGDTARRIADGGWHERIPSDQAPTELDQLRSVLNASFERIASSYEQQRRFTADASHELGTPVAVILSKTQFALSRPRTPAEYVDALSVCQRAGERMKALAGDLLDLAAYDARSAPARSVDCDLAEIAHESVSLVAPLAASRQAILVERFETIPVLVDPLGLSQVLVNLLTNAIAHNAPGVRVTLSVGALDAHTAELIVEDDGRGIPPEALEHVFARFFRADSARTREGGASGGSGLGLAIAHRIVELHGGTIAAGNRPAGGARFVIRLPRHAPASA